MGTDVMTCFDGLDAARAAAFCARWLPAWTGNDPGGLVAFYAGDAFYSDPALPDGIRGREALLAYFTRLLARFPDWEWTHERSLPLPAGFLNYWRARFTRVGPDVRGVCVVQLREGLIVRNEVFFDRVPILPLLR